ncbi:MAG: hypothetical protein V3T77_11460, partial [Planctomycetota bacterium]
MLASDHSEAALEIRSSRQRASHLTVEGSLLCLGGVRSSEVELELEGDSTLTVYGLLALFGRRIELELKSPQAELRVRGTLALGLIESRGRSHRDDALELELGGKVFITYDRRSLEEALDGLDRMEKQLPLAGPPAPYMLRVRGMRSGGACVGQALDDLGDLISERGEDGDFGVELEEPDPAATERASSPPVDTRDDSVPPPEEPGTQNSEDDPEDDGDGSDGDGSAPLAGPGESGEGEESGSGSSSPGGDPSDGPEDPGPEDVGTGAPEAPEAPEFPEEPSDGGDDDLVDELDADSDTPGSSDLSLDPPDNPVVQDPPENPTEAGSVQRTPIPVEGIHRTALKLHIESPPFLTQDDEGVLTARVENKLLEVVAAQVTLELEGPELDVLGPRTQWTEIPARGEAQLHWRVAVRQEGVAVVRFRMLSSVGSATTELRLPVHVHGQLRTAAVSGSLLSQDGFTRFSMWVPESRHIEKTRLEIHTTPSLLEVLVKALPHLERAPYTSTEQTLNRFLSTIIIQKLLVERGENLAAISRYRSDPVFDVTRLRHMAVEGVQALRVMQRADGGWGWFSGWGERTDAHATATVVHGLVLAEKHSLKLFGGVLERGVVWLLRYQEGELHRLRNAATRTSLYKESVDNLDALVHRVLVEAGQVNSEMLEFLHRDRHRLALSTQSLLGLTFEELGQEQRLAELLKSLRGSVVRGSVVRGSVVKGKADQTASLSVPEATQWLWFGNKTETQAVFLKLLARTDPHGSLAAEVARYLIHHRHHASYWSSTRDTALCIEALAEYFRATGEKLMEMTVEVWCDGQKWQQTRFRRKKLFRSANRVLISGSILGPGEHQVEIRRRGTGPLYFSGFLTLYTPQQPRLATGTDLQVERKYYKLLPPAKAGDKSHDRPQPR